ncbi:hypothetical protein D3P07_22955 [Paenibacillus sp. 1011MAR3C5]|nr:hypothetical protein D3P07_22955 [Paenibacillus sp. 1011MAR3C5]
MANVLSLHFVFVNRLTKISVHGYASIICVIIFQLYYTFLIGGYSMKKRVLRNLSSGIGYSTAVFF